MSSAIDKIILRNFKAFPDDKEGISINFNSENVLLYGENGSGKSSIYWSLYTLFQSSSKEKEQIQKYFDPKNDQNLINLHYLINRPDFDTKKDGSILYPESVGLNSYVDVILKSKQKFRIDRRGFTSAKINVDGSEVTNTVEGKKIVDELNRVSDFISHRLLINFYNFRNSKEINLWEVFVRDIFPFLKSNRGNEDFTLWERLSNIKNNFPFDYNTNGSFNISRSKQKKNWIKNEIKLLNEDIEYWMVQINGIVQTFYDTHFEELYQDKLKISISYKTHLSYDHHQKQYHVNDGREYHRNTTYAGLNQPLIKLNLEFDKKGTRNPAISRPQSYLNEARLTCVALAIRFSLLDNSIKPDTDGQFLALDDLLVSLDMNNRDKVMDILLGVFAKKFKIYLFTHERRFYEFCKYKIQQFNQKDYWSIQEIYEPDRIGNKPTIINSEYTNYDKAKKYYNAKDYVTSSLYLRREFEKVVKERLPKEYTKTVEGEFRNLAHYWKLFRDHYKALSIDMDAKSPNMNKDFEQSKAFILNRQAHHNLSEPVYTIELKKVFDLIEEIKSQYPVPETTILLSEGMQLKFSHPNKDYSIEFTLLNDFVLDKIGGNSKLLIPKCKIITWQFEGTAFWDFTKGKVSKPEKAIEHKLSKIKNTLTDSKMVPFNISNDMFLGNTYVNGVWELKEMLDEFDVKF